MSDNTATQRPTVVEGETRNFAVDFRGKLDSGEKLTGTVTVEEETSADLTFSNKVVSTAALTIDGKTVAIGKAVQFKATGFKAATGSYTIKITVGTDSSPAQTLIAYVTVDVEA